jgi:hypothetical protein
MDKHHQHTLEEVVRILVHANTPVNRCTHDQTINSVKRHIDTRKGSKVGSRGIHLRVKLPLTDLLSLEERYDVGGKTVQ